MNETHNETLGYIDPEINAFGSASALDEAERAGEAALAEAAIVAEADTADHVVAD